MTDKMIIKELKTLLEAALLKIEQLERENAELRAKLNLNSSNSSLPPSSDKFSKKKIRRIGLFVRKVINLLVDKLVIKDLLLNKLIILIS